MDFESWWKKSSLEGSVHMSYYLDAEAAWKAATLAERERCAKVCDRIASSAEEEAKGSDLFYGSDQWYGGAVDAAEECANAIRNP